MLALFMPDSQSTTALQSGVNAQPRDSAQVAQSEGKFSSVLAAEGAGLEDLNGENLPKEPKVPQSQGAAAMDEICGQIEDRGKGLPLSGNFNPLTPARHPLDVTQLLADMRDAPGDAGTLNGLSAEVVDPLISLGGVPSVSNNQCAAAMASNQWTIAAPANRSLQAITSPLAAGQVLGISSAGTAAGSTVDVPPPTLEQAVDGELVPAKRPGPWISPASALAATFPTTPLAAIQAHTEAQGAAAMTMHMGPTVVSPGAFAAPTNMMTPSLTLDKHFWQPGWDGAIGDRVMWMVNQQLRGAKIRLNPPELGPIEVRINMRGDHAEVSFSAQHASVREALEAAVPRLRDMFSSAGLGLGDVNVAQHSFGQPRTGYGQRRGDGAGFATTDLVEPEESAVVDTATGLMPRGVIDLFV
jgi:flagellar hook-length control protein FliK